jgi:hypothetical protein
MANSYVTYTGDGATTARVVPFSYIQTSHVHVYLDDVETLLFTWVTAGQINITTAPAIGVVIKVARETPVTAPLVTFTDGPVRRAKELNNNTKQAIYAAEEAVETVAVYLAIVDGDAAAAAASAAAALVSENAAAADAVLTNDDVVLTYADVVLTHADVVLTHADVVLTHADVVLTHADVILAEADKVQTGLDRIATAADRVQTGLDVIAAAASEVAAELAETNAETAETNAEAAQVAAEAARDLAVTARIAAQLAETNAETAEVAAELAETNAETAETNAETAQTAAETARNLSQTYSLMSGFASYNFDTSTSVGTDPGTGDVRFNNATVGSVTTVCFSSTDALGASLTAFLATLDDLGATGGRGYLIFRSRSDPTKLLRFLMTGSIATGTGYTQVTVSGGTGTLPTNAEALSFQFAWIGSTGATGTQAIPPGPLLNFETTLTSPPGTNSFRFNNATPASVTSIFVVDTPLSTGGTIDMGLIIGSLVAGDRVSFRGYTTPAQYLLFDVTGTPTDNTGSWTIPVTYVAATGLPSNGNDLSFFAELKGPAMSAATILAALLTVDGAGSGLDADLLDGQSSAAFATASHTHAQSDITSLVSDLAAKAPLASPTFTGTVGGITKSMVGLGSVDNTSDATKDAASATLTNKTLTDPIITGTTREDTFTITDGAAFAIDPRNGSIQTVTLTASRTPVASNFNNGDSVTLHVADGTAYAITWTTVAVTWVGGVAPTLATTGYTIIELWKTNSVIYGSSPGAVA